MRTKRALIAILAYLLLLPACGYIVLPEDLDAQGQRARKVGVLW